MANAPRLAELGFPVPLATELAAQITAQDGDRKRLEALSMEPLLAKEVAAQIDAAGTTNAPRLVDFGMVPDEAVELVAQIEADREE